MKLPSKTYERLVLLNTALLLVFVLVGLFAMAYALRQDKVRRFVRAVIAREVEQSQALAPLRDDDGAAPLPAWSIKIAPEHFREIQALAAHLVDAKALANRDKRWFPARFYADGEEYRGKIRLRGDLGQHWTGAKKSWRFRFKREQLFQGRRELDLILPRDKGYQVETVSYTAARRLGLLAPDAGFAAMRINGVDMGPYLWREPLGKEALEKLRYPEGEIFAEQNVWIQEFFTKRGIYEIPSPPVSFFPGNYKLRIHEEDGAGGYYAARFGALLRLITEADDDTFARQLPGLLDIEKYLTWNALTWLFGSTHSHWGDNLNWYYDSTTGRFEPLLYDVFRYALESRHGTFEHEEHDDLALRVLQVPAWRQRRNAILWRLLNEPDFDLAARCSEALGHLGRAFYHGVDAVQPKEYQAFQRETLEILEKNRTKLRDHLAFARLFTAATATFTADGTPALRVRLVPDALPRLDLEGLRIDLAVPEGASLDSLTLDSFPLETITAHLAPPAGATVPLMVQARREGESLSLQLSDAALLTPLDDRLLPRLGEYQLTLTLPGLDAAQWRTPGLVRGLAWEVRNSTSGELVALSHLFQAPLAYDFDPAAITVDVAPDVSHDPAVFIAATGLPLRFADGTYVLAAGTHAVDHDLVFPTGAALRIEAGARLRMGPGASILVRGPITAAGTDAAPITITPRDPARPWGAFGVVAADAPSHVRHTLVRGGSEDRVDGAYLSGQLVFYRADVDLEASAILDARADDGLNVKHATLNVRRCLLAGNASDAIDGDWVTGTVEASVFRDNGGDGLDLSGSRLVARGNLFLGMGDKALSIGEKSDFTGIDNVLRDSLVGIAIKDLSTAHLYASVLYRNRTAVALYRKKPIFGGGSGELVSSLLWENATLFEVDDESALSLVGVGRPAGALPATVSERDGRHGEVGTHYRVAGEAGFLHIGGADSPFAQGPATTPETQDGVTIPDLSQGPVGLLAPLELEAPWPRLDDGS